MQKAIEIIQQYCTNQRVCVAVSGGVDSICLAHLLLQYQSKLGRLAVLTVEHGIRGQDSQQDAQFVVNFCQDNQVECFLFTIDVPTLARQNGKSIELQARESRRQIYQQVLAKGFDYIALAHHADDQIETVLYRFLRGTGIKGLMGMQVVTRDRLLRPLLTTTKQQITNYVSQNSISFVEDATNADTQYARNYLRMQIIPQLRQHFDIVGAVTRLSQNAKDTQDFLQDKIDYSAIQFKDNRAYINQDSLISTAICVNYLYYIFENLSIDSDISKTKVDKLLHMSHLPSGKTVEFGDGVMGKVQYSQIVIFQSQQSPIPAIHNPQTQSTSLSISSLNILPQCPLRPDLIGHYQLGNQSIFISPLPYCPTFSPPPPKSLSPPNPNYLPNQFPNRVLLCDIQKLPPNTTLRHRQTGDLFCPYNGKTTTLKKYLINQKIPQEQRDSLLVLANDNHILAVCGLQIADSIKIDNHTKQALEIHIS